MMTLGFVIAGAACGLAWANETPLPPHMYRRAVSIIAYTVLRIFIGATLGALAAHVLQS